MNSLLLDTHVLIWAVLDPRRLSSKARVLLEDPSLALVVSAASAWEIATKFRLGKLPGSARIVADYRGTLGRLGVRSLPITDEHALAAGSLAGVHRDPFDRMIAAQAVIEGLGVVTSDGGLAGLPGVRVEW